MLNGEAFVLGLDYGSDSVRAVLIDASNGDVAGSAVMNFPRWEQGLYCDAAANRFRQHPLDYVETLEGTVREACAQAGAAAAKVKGIAIDATGATPCAAGADGVPLSLQKEFAENPDAMFLLWKDHTAVAEAEKINALIQTWDTDYVRYEGGVYSAEWFWAKVMYVLARDEKIAAAAETFVEHCDWLPFLLCGGKTAAGIKRSRCAMGHKAMWHRTFGGYPSDEFFTRLDPELAPRLLNIKRSLGTETFTSDTPAGFLCGQWARRLGLPEGIPVAVGAFDAHMGAVGGGVRPGALIRVMGTSTCDVTVGGKPAPGESEKPVRGICGQVDGSVIPGLIGYEAGQSAFGDVYAWFKKILMWPVEALTDDDELKARLSKKIIPEIERAAAEVDPATSGIVALDWLNGRRTPVQNQRVRAAIAGLSLGADAPKLYRALAEATAFGARAIVECFTSQGVPVNEIIGVGGVARKSPFVMQILADVLDMPINVPAGEQHVALGAAMFAAVAAGLYPDIPSAQQKLCPPEEKVYYPDQKMVTVYKELYKQYQALGLWAGARR